MPPAGQQVTDVANKTFERIDKALGILALLAIALMMISTVADVTGRYLLNYPIPGTVELNRTLLVYTAFLTLAYAQLKKRHMRVGFVVDLLN